jgi:hypothetical protein
MHLSCQLGTTAKIANNGSSIRWIADVAEFRVRSDGSARKGSVSDKRAIEFSGNRVINRLQIHGVS